MNPAGDYWLSLLLVALFAGLLLLRVKFPNASKASENTVLVAATILFFLICTFFLAPRAGSAQSVEDFTQIRAFR
jgi:hypothetical protein